MIYVSIYLFIYLYIYISYRYIVGIFWGNLITSTRCESLAAVAGMMGIRLEYSQNGSTFAGELFGFSQIIGQYFNGHFRNLNWRYLPYIRPI